MTCEIAPDIAAIVQQAGFLVFNRIVAHEILSETFSGTPECYFGDLRDNKPLQEPNSSGSLTYGEISLASLIALLERIADLNDGSVQCGKFVDLGSGFGRVVLAAALLGEYNSCLGIEIDKYRHVEACAALDCFDCHQLRPLATPDVRFHCEDATGEEGQRHWLDADCVYICCTCFDDELMRTLALLVEGLKPGVCVVTLTKRLPAALGVLALDDELAVDCSWGHANIFIERRTALKTGATSGNWKNETTVGPA